jgi:hypothetical protein
MAPGFKGRKIREYRVMENSNTANARERTACKSTIRLNSVLQRPALQKERLLESINQKRLNQPLPKCKHFSFNDLLPNNPIEICVLL